MGGSLDTPGLAQHSTDWAGTHNVIDSDDNSSDHASTLVVIEVLSGDIYLPLSLSPRLLALFARFAFLRTDYARHVRASPLLSREQVLVIRFGE